VTALWRVSAGENSAPPFLTTWHRARTSSRACAASSWDTLSDSCVAAESPGECSDLVNPLRIKLVFKCRVRGPLESSMNRVLLSLCLLGAALATANTLFLQRPACRSIENETAALPSAGSASQPARSSTPRAKAATLASKDATGSISGGAKAKPSKLDHQTSEWVEVSVAVRVRIGPSLSAPIIRYYRAGTKLRVLERQTDWTKIVDPITSKDGWIYARYLSSSEEPSQTQADLRKEPPFTEPSRPGWKWYGSQQRPRFRIVFGVRPRW
jgi:hypothetical protein